MRALVIAAACLLGSTACAGGAGPDARDSAFESISYETLPCYGLCPVYRFTVRGDGRGEFDGRQATPVSGRRDFRVSRAQFDAFARHLERVRPDSGSIRIEGTTCPEIQATDQPSVEVTWRHHDGSIQQLHYYYGCAPERFRELVHRVGTAPYLLPIGDLVGPRR